MCRHFDNMISHIYRNLSSSCLIHVTQRVFPIYRITNHGFGFSSWFILCHVLQCCVLLFDQRNQSLETFTPQNILQNEMENSTIFFAWKNRRKTCGETVVHDHKLPRPVWNWEEISRHKQNQSKQTKYTSRNIYHNVMKLCVFHYS